MLARIRRSRQNRRLAAALYDAIVAQARHPAFFTGYRVPDTVEGRFEMVVVHLVVVLRRLKEDGDGDSRARGQAAFDLFCRDMDRTLREMGVGDLAVPKRMRRVGEAYYGRAAAYEPAIGGGDRAGLAAALGRTVGDGADVATAALATYILAADRALAAAPPEELRSAVLPFPDPEALLTSGAAP